MFFVLRAVSGVPLPWNKTDGCDIVSCVRVELYPSQCQLGISARRVGRFVRWVEEVAGKATVNLKSYEDFKDDS